jgi:signal transduction histidine kinase
LKRLDAPNLSEHLMKSEGKFRMKIDGEDSLVYYRKNAAVGWFILVALPYDSIMLSVREILSLITLIDILLMGLLTLALSFISNRLISAPLHGMVSVINRIEGGERNARIRIQSNDEFALLGKEFNKLVDAVEEYSSSLESKVRERTEELRALQKENTRLKVAEERRRIYRDMHDTLGAKLTNIFFCNNVARSALEREPEKLAELFDGIETNCQDAVRSLKEIIENPQQEEAAENDFPGMIIERTRRRLAQNGIALVCRDRTGGAAAATDPATKAELVKIFDEIVSNALKHSGADRANLAFEAEGGMLRFRFKDNGKGFDGRTALSSGSGLSNIDFRVGRLGGAVKIRSRLGKGTEFTVAVPIARPAQGETE